MVVDVVCGSRLHCWNGIFLSCCDCNLLPYIAKWDSLISSL